MPLNNRGFTLIQVMMALGLIAVFVVMGLEFSNILNRRLGLARNTSTKNRILSGIRDLAGMPASLRMSMRASNGTTAVNPELLACVGGNPANSCKNGDVYPFTLYSPVLQRDAAGLVLGGQAISAPLGSTTPMRIDSFGGSCTVPGPDCPFRVATSFRAQCAPQTGTLQVVPQATCTVADVIEVTYYVQLDPSILTSDPSLTSFVTPTIETVVVPVVLISGNLPQ